MSAPRCSLLDGMEGRKLMFGLTYKTPAIGSLSQAGLTWRGIIMCEARLPMARAYCFHRSADERIQVGPFSIELGRVPSSFMQASVTRKGGGEGKRVYGRVISGGGPRHKKK